ncbi:hypothetical protein [Rhodoferax sp.]|uniref:hypothetical protein n=1 Tax=Rhodoferax sp. TaxID=50421 RepID=UPI001A0D6593|nr:hypothetical protein [Rhodoferax sp.]MBE0475040.1 hypothetical protein [Rhodoferax sp.]
MSRRYTCPQKGDGLGAPHDQPVKTLTKYVADFIAAATRYATFSAGLNALFLVLVLQFLAMAWGVL